MSGLSRSDRTRLSLTATDVLESQATGFKRWLYRLRNFVFGRPPHVRSWHPRWPDYRMFMDLAQRHFAGAGGSLLIISNAPAAFGNFLSGVSQSAVSFDLTRFLTLNRDQYRPLLGSFEGCLLVLGDAQISRAHDLIRRIKALLAQDRTLLVFAVNGHGAELGPWFSGDMLHDVGQFFDHDMPIEEVALRSGGPVALDCAARNAERFLLVQKNWLWMPVESFVVGILTIVSFVCNLGRRSSANPPRNQSCSSVGLVMRKVVPRVQLKSKQLMQSRSLFRRSAFFGVGRIGGHIPRESRRKCCGKEMSAGLRIGIDFDNTIITYDDVFLATARAWGLVGARFYRTQAGDPRCHPVAAGRRVVMAKIARSSLRQRPHSGGNV